MQRIGRLRAAAALLVVFALASCDISIRHTFAELSYPPTQTASVVPSAVIATTARMLPHLLAGYEDPDAVARCFSALAARPAESLLAFGRCRLGVPGHQDWNVCLPQLYPGDLTVAGGQVTCAGTPLGHRDGVRVRLALGNAAEAFVAYVRQLCPLQMGAAVPGPDFSLSRCGQWAETDTTAASLVQHTLERAGSIVDRHGVSGAPSPGALERPTLALSGGSGNGAFIAGYVYALLFTQETIRFCATRPSEPRCAGVAVAPDALSGERFAAVTGTSVGSLVGAMLDAYYADGAGSACPIHPRAPLNDNVIGRVDRDTVAQETAALGEIVPAGWRSCAMSGLWEYFARSSEGDVLCIRRGNISQPIRPVLGGPMDSLLEFSPMRADVERFFRAVHTATESNAVIRESLSVDIRQNVLASLDERSCITTPDSVACETDAIMASVSLPMWVSPVSSVVTGLVVGRTEGAWLDGGLRSGVPALRALQLGGLIAPHDGHIGAGRVLALNTHRASGTHATVGPDTTGLTMLIESISPMIEEIRESEMATTEIYGREQRRRFCATALDWHVAGEFDCDATTEMLAAIPITYQEVWPEFVPTDLPDAVVAGGYTFDPIVLTSLFYAGVRVFLRTVAREDCSAHSTGDLDALYWLGWMGTRRGGRQLADNQHSPVSDLCRRAVRYEQAVSVAVDHPNIWQDHVNRRHDTVQNDMPACASAGH